MLRLDDIKKPEDMINQIVLGDCLDLMKRMPDNFVDLIVTDPPYGVTANAWDKLVDFMDAALRVSRGVVLTAMQPYSSELVVKYRKHFKYEWVWHKAVGSNFANLKYQPMREHEQILVFGNPKYNPIKQPRNGSGAKRLETPYFTNSEQGGENTGIKRNNAGREYDKNLRYPSSVQYFNNRDKDARGLHPTQKPLKMFEYLVKTYSDEGDTVYDPFNGSGTTTTAASNLNRNFIGSEISKEYCEIAEERLKQGILL